MNNKVVIIGCSNVGMAFAHNLVLCGHNVDELVLIDILEDKIAGEAIDLNHTQLFTDNLMKIKNGTYADCADASLCVICAGRNQKPNETRQQLIDSNIDIVGSIIDQCKASGFDGIYILVSNPVDLLSLHAYKRLGIDASKVIGSGTSLDTSRLRFAIGEKLGINPKHIDAYVLGEHGDSEMIAWDSATIAGKPISDFLSNVEMQEIAKEVKDSAYQIINKKGFTNYGISSALGYLTKAILADEDYVLPVSTYDAENNIFYSRPCVIGRCGIKKVFDIQLSKNDKINLDKSIAYLKEMRDKSKIK